MSNKDLDFTPAICYQFGIILGKRIIAIGANALVRGAFLMNFQILTKR
ncbi:MAG TPA: hypothetical protein VNE86_07935 [Nitrososphaerales archaeon]|nr:hypothetical protein [Nitrososphaerales archaeon]